MGTGLARLSTRASADSMTRVGCPRRFPRSAAWRHVGIAVAVFLAYVSLSGVARAQTPKPFMNYLKPTPITCSPLSSASWGVAGVLPRDTCNGIESAKGAAVPPEFYYWDGQIIKAKDGKYHMFMSTWSGTAGFNPGWQSSDAYHAISSMVRGPLAHRRARSVGPTSVSFRATTASFKSWNATGPSRSRTPCVAPT